MPEIIATDRYAALGIEPSACPGPCEGTGVVPVYMSKADSRDPATTARPGDEDDPRLVAAWEEAEAEEPAEDGWHFVPCPECS